MTDFYDRTTGKAHDIYQLYASFCWPVVSDDSEDATTVLYLSEHCKLKSFVPYYLTLSTLSDTILYELITVISLCIRYLYKMFP